MTSPRRPRAPLDELSLLRREIDQLFERLGAWSASEQPAAGEWFPAVDVFESQGRLSVQVEVPGLAADALRVVVRDGQLVITGERRAARAPQSGRFLCVERPVGRFKRTLVLDAALDLQAARAHLAHGLLTVTLPRRKERRNQETEIPVIREPER